MSRISGGQFAALLLITDAFTLFCLMGNISILTCAGFLVGIIIQFLFALPAVNFYRNGGTMKNSPKPFMWFYLIYLLMWGGLLFVMLWNASDALSIPSENFSIVPEKLLISGLIAVICLYASSPGIRSLSRAAVISAALGAFCITLVIISAVPDVELKYLTDLSYADGFFSELARGFVLSGGAGSFIVLLGYTKSDTMRCTAGYFAGKAILYTAVTLTAVAVAGGIMEIADFPVIMAAELSQPFTSQRIDSLFLIIFSILAVFSISIQTASASFLLVELFPSFKHFRSTFVLAAMVAAAFLLAGLDQYSVLYCAASVAAGFVVPVFMLLCRKNKRS